MYQPRAKRVSAVSRMLGPLLALVRGKPIGFWGTLWNHVAAGLTPQRADPLALSILSLSKDEGPKFHSAAAAAESSSINDRPPCHSE